MQTHQVVDHLRSLGFDISDYTPDGKIYRFSRNGSKDSGWYISWQNSRLSTGEHYYVTLFGDWRTGESHIHKPDKLTRADNVAIESQIKEKQLFIQKEREANQLKTADKAERYFSMTVKVGVTPYMDRKKIPELYGAGIYGGDRLQIPMRDVTGMIWSLQTILPDGSKVFMKGGRKKGCFHVIGETLTDEGMAYACEGFATAVSIHLATGKSVIVTFDAGNLIDVVGEIVKTYPKLSIVICGDDDRNNEANPGRKKAEKAALLSSGTVVFPKFPETDAKSTDFNDLHCLHGLEAVKEQLVESPVERQTGFIPLGYDEQTYFFYHIPSKDIVKATTFTPVQMYRIAPVEYWEAHYPTKKGPDLHKAMHDLIQISAAVGPFDASRIRGTGVWVDRKRITINTGYNLIVDKKPTSLGSLSSWHIYVQTRNRMSPIHSQPITAAEGERISKICRSFRWKTPTDGYLLSGWLFGARIAGACPIRPHIWLTGGKGTGKSTVMERLVAPLLGSPKGKIHIIGSTTEAGIRQAIRCSSLPIIFDEFESTGRSSRERNDAIIELLRSAWSTTEGRIIKGSASGNYVEFQLSFPAFVSSIRVRLDNDADRSRFSVLELEPHGDGEDQWKLLREMLAEVDEDLGERVFARACAMVHEVIACFHVISRHLGAKISQRFGQQVGMLLAFWWCLCHDNVITEEQALNLVKEWVVETPEEAKEDLSDEEECLNALLTHKVTLYVGTVETVNTTIGAAITEKTGKCWPQLVHSGIRVVGDRFSVANKHSELEKLFRGSRWESNWSRPLKRLPGAKCEHPAKFGSKVASRSVSLPVSCAELD